MDETQNNNLVTPKNTPPTSKADVNSSTVPVSPVSIGQEIKSGSVKENIAPIEKIEPATTTFSAPIMNTAKASEVQIDSKESNIETPVNPVVEPTPAEKELAEKLERAKLAMEGPTRTAIREEREHELDVKSKLAAIDFKLAEIAKQKESLEINWIKLDENRTGLRKMIDPIVERETKLEVDESQLEEQEKNTVGERERTVIEQKRWAIQEERHKAEEEKWVYDNRLFKIEDQIKDNTAAYQKILDEETALLNEREAVEKSAI